MVVLLLSLCSLVHADDRITIIVSGIKKQIYVPVVLAERLGYFAKQGLEVELQTESAGVHAQDMLLTGLAQGVVGAYDHTIELQSRGKEVLSVVQFGIAPGEVELVAQPYAATIQAPKDLHGH